MKQTIYETTGTCSKFINLELDEDQRVHNVQFIGGCPGNTIGVARLVEGKKAQDVIDMLQGVRCGYKSTSCPDQLAMALTKALTEQTAG